MSHLCYRRHSSRVLLALIAAAGLVLAACDHAKDLVDQGKKQAADIQKSLEEKTEKPAEKATSSDPVTPAATTPPATTVAPPAARPTVDPAAVIDAFMKTDNVNKTDGMLQGLEALPEEFRARITQCDLFKSHVTDVGLVELAKFPNLVLLNVTACKPITDTGLAAIKDLKLLEVLILDQTAVTDAGMAYLHDLPNLKILNLNQTVVTDAGILQIGSLAHIEELYINSTKIDGTCFRKVPLGNSLRVFEAGGTGLGLNLDVLKGHPELEVVNLYGAKVNDKTIGVLKGHAKLRILNLGLDPITDVGVKHLTGLVSLEDITFRPNRQITDEALTVLKPYKKLTHIGDRDTSITAMGPRVYQKNRTAMHLRRPLAAVFGLPVRMVVSPIRPQILFLTMAAAAALAPGGSMVPAADSLQVKLAPLIAAHEGKVAVAVKHLKTGESFYHNADTPMPTASLIKLPIMVEAYHQAESGKVDLKKLITLRQEDKAPGSGILTQHFSAGMSLPLVDAIHLMIVYSDNTATNLVLDQIGLPATNTAMEKFGFAHTKVHSKVFRGDTSILPERSKEFGLGSTTAGEMVGLLDLLDQGKLAGDEGTKEMRRHLAACEDKRLSRGFPPEIKVLQKTGSVTAIRTVAGIIELPSGNVAVCVLTNDNKDRRWAADNAGEVLAANIGHILLEHFQPDWRTAVKEADLVLRVGSQGARVEKLQRALNEKLAPSPELNLDGEFGPVTRAAVVAWQKVNKLLESGEINLEAWKLLGLPADLYRPSK